MIRAVRVYQVTDDDTGARWLVDRLWTRGLRRSSLELTGWARDAAPSDRLRRRFGHDPHRWEEFQRDYAGQLDSAPTTWRPLLDAARDGDLLLVYAARDVDHNNAIALRNYLGQQMSLPGRDHDG